MRRRTDPGYVVAAGTGEVFSYVVHHHPPVPGKQLPLVIALVELDEGVRMLAEMQASPPTRSRIGMPVRVEYLRIDDELTLPAWRAAGDGPPRPAAGRARPDPRLPRSRRQRDLPEWSSRAPTFVVASALATRDFPPVHHDRDLAIANGSKDIFVNILTDTGLVQRFVSDWAGPQALLREIEIRLGVPCYAGDTLTFSGRVSERRRASERGGRQVTGRCSLGDHVIATVPTSGASHDVAGHDLRARRSPGSGRPSSPRTRAAAS